MVESWAELARSTSAKIFVLLVCFLIHGSHAQKVTEDKYFTNGWAIQVPEPGGYGKAKDIAKRHGFEKVSPVSTKKKLLFSNHTCNELVPLLISQEIKDLPKEVISLLWASETVELVFVHRANLSSKRMLRLKPQ